MNEPSDLEQRTIREVTRSAFIVGIIEGARVTSPIGFIPVPRTLRQIYYENLQRESTKYDVIGGIITGALFGLVIDANIAYVIQEATKYFFE